MKTLVLSVVIAMTSVLNTVSGNNLPEFAYNTTTNGEQVESQTVYTVENDKYLHPHLKYNYTYNADGSVSKKPEEESTGEKPGTEVIIIPGLMLRRKK